MYKKKLFIGVFKINISINTSVFAKDENKYFFGYPYNFSDSFFSNNNAYCINNLKGYWLKIDIHSDEVNITTDILAGYKIYSIKLNNRIFISDNYNVLLKELNGNYTINNEELKYWKNHSYTTGDSTFINEIKKISPASTLKINTNSVLETNHFLNVERNFNEIEYAKCIHNDLTQVITQITKNTFPKINFVNLLTSTSFKGIISDPFNDKSCIEEKKIALVIKAFNFILNPKFNES